MSRINDGKTILTGPGDVILETLEHLRMSQAELAKRIGKTPSKVNDLITGKEPITVNTAVQLENALGIDTQFWLNRETLYREKLVRLEQEEFLESCRDWLKQQPLKELKKYGYISREKRGADMVAECLKFYGVNTPLQWEQIYVSEYANTAFRKSTTHAIALGSMAAWLRIGEVEMRKLQLSQFSKEKFKEILAEIRILVKTHPGNFATRLVELCAQAGVAVVYSPSLPQARISGATRWIGGRPLIQLTDRYKSNDHFWFTFFHEAGHILLHGRKDVFIETFEGHSQDPVQESEANDFAFHWLLPKEFISDVPDSKITEKDIRSIAAKFDTHPAIVVARLVNTGHLTRGFGTHLKVKVILDDFIYKSK